MPTKPTPPPNPPGDISQELSRHLFEQSSVFTRAAHALEAAADQLRQAHSSNFENAAAEARSASMVAMHAALSAHQLVGAYELAAWFQTRRSAS